MANATSSGWNTTATTLDASEKVPHSGDRTWHNTSRPWYTKSQCAQNSCVPSQGRHTEGKVWTPWTHLWSIPVHDNNFIKTLKLDSKCPRSLRLHKRWSHRGLGVTTLSAESYFSLEPLWPSSPWLTQGSLANWMILALMHQIHSWCVKEDQCPQSSVTPENVTKRTCWVQLSPGQCGLPS